jgi:hypothetical protein
MFSLICLVLIAVVVGLEGMSNLRGPSTEELKWFDLE